MENGPEPHLGGEESRDDCSIFKIIVVKYT